MASNPSLSANALKKLHIFCGFYAIKNCLSRTFKLKSNYFSNVICPLFSQFGSHKLIAIEPRLGRFLMNLMLASGRYPWTIVPLERRSDYMATLESASVVGNIMPFASLLAELLNKSR